MSTAAGQGTDELVWESRPTLSVWCYDTPMGAAAGQVRLRELQRRGGVDVADSVTVTWVRGTHRPRIGHLRAPRLPGHPWPGYSALGALAGILAASTGGRDPLPLLAARLADTGLDETVLRDLRRAIAPGGSVLLVLSTGADPAQVQPIIQRGLDRGDVTLTHVVLAADVVPRLRVAVERVLLANTQTGRPRAV